MAGNIIQRMPMDISPRACRALWASVLLVQWSDAFPESRVTKRGGGAFGRRSRDYACDWFGSRDFHQVCALAGLDGSSVMSRFHARLRQEQAAGCAS
ncbi:hypothetical protein [Pseudorhodobacter sp.]|uniref:hypothetical protein n=1 Tax=Pseudorhodobacter sp. TaxID=1934400 RepID=UPI00264A11FC|nr:hypothetical protein [Pseudorhodobacter sp.]MDN5789037.1 hypothetical protein [Pseudorhodobacter sp.]